MSRPTTEIRARAAEIRTFLRKAAELDTELWLHEGLPQGHPLSEPKELARMVVGLEEELADLLRRQREHFEAWMREHPPKKSPVAVGALEALPPTAVLTYHEWLGRLAEADGLHREELAELLRLHLQEAIGAGALAAHRNGGLAEPGFGVLGRREAAVLRRRMEALPVEDSPELRGLMAALQDRADPSTRGAALRDGAGRVVAACTYRPTRDGRLEIRTLGSIEEVAPGSAVQMLREMAGLAADKGLGLAILAPSESRPVLEELGFVGGQRSTLSPGMTARLAAGSDLPAWARPGWLEGPLGRVVTKRAEEVHKAENGDLRVLELHGAGGGLEAWATYRLPAEGDLVIEELWLSPGAPAPTGRRLLRELARIAAEQGRGLTAKVASGPTAALLGRLGFKSAEGRLVLGTEAVAAMAAGLTRGAAWTGQLAWELGVAGAKEWLERDVIPKVVEEVSETTYRRLLESMAEGLARGEGTNELIARLRNLDDQLFGLVRAERIARTEVITANRAGAFELARAAGAGHKRWVSRLMPNTRAWHREAHGQEVPIDEPFVVANRHGEPEELMFPGDRSRGASADNVIQCVCAALPIKLGVTDAVLRGMEGEGTYSYPGPLAAWPVEQVTKRAEGLRDLRARVAAGRPHARASLEMLRETMRVRC